MTSKKTDIEKIVAYRRFWDRQEVERPLMGFDIGGFFPFRRFETLRRIRGKGVIQPEMIIPQECLDNYASFYRESTRIDDDLIKGVSPIPAIPWMEAMLGCPVKVLGESIWAEERRAEWNDLEDLTIEDDNPWLRKYLEFLRISPEPCVVTPRRSLTAWKHRSDSGI
jgi:hypothetical protein